MPSKLPTPSTTSVPNQHPELYCSKTCEDAVTVRSFGRCPECRLSWNGQGAGGERHYRNNAWKLCDTCARQQNRCVVCARTIDCARQIDVA